MTARSGAAGELALQVRGVGRGTLATILGRVFDVAATYVFYATVARSIPVSEFGRFVLAFAILQTAAAAARLGLDQALLAADANGATNRFGLKMVLASSVTITGVVLIAGRLAGHPLPTFGLWLAAAFPCVPARLVQVQ